MSSDRKKILIVDDEPDVLEYFTAFLEDHGYATVTAIDGEEALEKIRSGQPDLITLDISMPEKSGIKFFREIKVSNEWSSIPVIIVTGTGADFNDFISAHRSIPLPEGYLSKPVDQQEILELIGKLTSN